MAIWNNITDCTNPLFNKPVFIEKYAELSLSNTPSEIPDEVFDINFSSAAFSDNDEIVFSLYAKRPLCVTKVKLILFYDFSDKKENYTLNFDSFCENYEKYVCKIKKEVGLYYFTFKLYTPFGKFYTDADNNERNAILKRSLEQCSKYQLLIYSSAYQAPKWFNKTVMYQIFVDRFCKFGKTVVRDDAFLNPYWENGIPEYAEHVGECLKNNTFFGGSLYGVIEKLDYLQSLGINLIYLCPIFKAFSNHKYDTGDYMQIDEMFGGRDAFDKLILEAHKRNIKIILDGVFNHTGDDSRYFNKYNKYNSIGAYNSKASAYYDWYRFTDYPDSYDSWWGIKILPALNHKSKELRNFICGDNGIIRHYLKSGIDGWRLDVADELPEDLLIDIKSSAHSEASDSIIIGEVWEDASNKISYSQRRHYFNGKQLDSVMNYPLKDAVIDFVLNGYEKNLVSTINLIHNHYPKEIELNLMNFLGTHDTERILSVLSGISGNGKSGSELALMKMPANIYDLAKKRLKIAFAILCACVGVPCIYYGDEIGMEGYRDPFNRCPFAWGKEDLDLLDFYKNIIEIRKSHSALQSGSMKIVCHAPGLIVFERENESEKIVFAVNLSAGVYSFYLQNNFLSILEDIIYTGKLSLSSFEFKFLLKYKKRKDM